MLASTSIKMKAKACNFLVEIERLDLLQEYVDKDVFPRVCLYLTR